MEKITSKDNHSIKEYHKLANSKSYREKTGKFAIESVKLIIEAIQSHVTIEKVFVTQSSYEKNYTILQKFFVNLQTNSYLITDELEQKLTQTNNAQGFFAICKKLDKHLDIGKIKKDGKYVFLSKLQDTGNVGTIIRTAEAMGLSGVIVSKDTCDVTSMKVLRASMGSVFRMKIYVSCEEVADIRQLSDYFSIYAAVLDKGAVRLTDVVFSPNSIVVIGNEGNGLSQQIIDICSEKITIQMAGNTESLNAGMAAGILMWEMMKS